MSDITHIAIYLTDFSSYVQMNEIYGRYFITDNPARATGKAALVNPEFLIEIEATAVL